MKDWVIKFKELNKKSKEEILDVLAGLMAEKAGVSEEEFWQEIIGTEIDGK